MTEKKTDLFEKMEGGGTKGFEQVTRGHSFQKEKPTNSSENPHHKFNKI